MSKYILTADGQLYHCDTSESELYHYGVTGMKWGHRKAAKFEAKAARLRKRGHTDDAKVYESKAKEVRAEGTRAEKFNVDYKTHRSSRSTGAKVATFLLAGPFANRTYSAVRAIGGTKTQAAVTTAAATILGGPFGNLAVSAIVKSHATEGGSSKATKQPYAKRTARGHAGPGVYATRKRQLAGDKRDLEALKNGQHLSVGLTKKRQAAYDARDKAILEKRIAKNEAKLRG